MTIVLLKHPDFTGTHSISLYTGMIAAGLRERNHEVEIWTAGNFFNRLPAPEPLKKWLGYIDRFVVFPFQFRRQLKKMSAETLFVFADHALGSWVSMAAGRPHVIHCHDFMAQRSALGEIPENRVGFSGKIYQYLIRRGYNKGQNFISISKKTQHDLEKFLGRVPKLSEVVYNGLNQNFRPGDTKKAKVLLQKELNLPLGSGFILHVGGDQFYKNRKGVIEIYNSFRKLEKQNIPLLFIGTPPVGEEKSTLQRSPFQKDIFFVSNISNRLLRIAYQGANVLLFPSLDEGFGWPIAEAMASGCPVITTDLAPMNEVAGKGAFYIPRRPSIKDATHWAEECAERLLNLIQLSEQDRFRLIHSGLENAKRFDTDFALEKIEEIYQNVLKREMSLRVPETKPKLV